MKDSYVLAYYDDDHKLLEATKKCRDKNIKIHDIFTPFPVHGLDEAMGIKRSMLPYVTLVAGAMGLSVALALQIFTSAIDWPINVGGKPFNSIPAFIPVSFELTVLFAAHITVGAFLAINKLFPGKEAQVIDPRQTEDLFIMAIKRPGKDTTALEEILKDFGAINIEKRDFDFE